MKGKAFEPGEKRGGVVLVRLAERRSSGAAWVCRCHCGKLYTTLAADVRAGKSHSCGCLRGKARARGAA